MLNDHVKVDIMQSCAGLYMLLQNPYIWDYMNYKGTMCSTVMHFNPHNLSQDKVSLDKINGNTCVSDHSRIGAVIPTFPYCNIVL